MGATQRAFWAATKDAVPSKILAFCASPREIGLASNCERTWSGPSAFTNTIPSEFCIEVPGVRHLKVMQETRTAEARRTQRFLHILCALCTAHLGEPNHPKVERSPCTSSHGALLIIRMS